MKSNLSDYIIDNDIKNIEFNGLSSIFLPDLLKNGENTREIRPGV